MPSPRVSGARVDHVLQQSREPVFWLNSELKLTWVNRAWEELTGHPAATVLGLACQPHGPTRAGDLAGLGGSHYPPPESLAGRPASVKTLIIHPSGERIWRRIEFWPFHNGKGELAALLGLVRSLDDPSIAPDSDTQRLRSELLELRERLHDRHGHDSLIGRGPPHRRLLDQVEAAAASSVPVLIAGDAGTGKRLVARTIHQLGPRRLSPLVPFDAAALPADVLERELFGPTPGDGAPVLSRLALPEGSTLVIGDILDLPRDLQGRLAAALDGPIRLIATTTGDPDAALRAERLRPDLYFALTTLVIRLTPLRERLDDLPLLAQHLLERSNLRGGPQRSGFSPEAIRTLLTYDWPGNVRELTRVVDDARQHAEGPLIETTDLPAAVRGHLASAYTPPSLPTSETPLDELLTQVERRLIENALQRCRDNKSRAAELLGISRPRLYRRIKELGLPDDPEPTEELATSPPTLSDGRE
jgi:transcriptional regulator with AAA-type ATPase domain